ncbi:hypothetical protein OHT52_02630 [Streptomyces sp. NBC_00247]|uniref:hypothetical protein n=1 Tax=Streptomyces sp. NBC_00247 TaxID=2975689 RepID=UPI002E2A13E8|nr:hypothetical protein [Streptomyces sp. NBC_00247]
MRGRARQRVREHGRERYAEVADVIETPASACQEAMYREANLLAPCKTPAAAVQLLGPRP